MENKKTEEYTWIFIGDTLNIPILVPRHNFGRILQVELFLNPDMLLNDLKLKKLESKTPEYVV